MEFSGFLRPYGINRPLKEEERQRQLHQSQRLDVKLVYQMSVIRSNATYMELVDKWFTWRGFMLTSAMLPLWFGFWMLWDVVAETLSTEQQGVWILFVMGCGGSFSMMAMSAWLIRADAFRFTHFPIRLNRKTRMVHVFRTNGTVLSVPWDEVFFCLGPLPQFHWEIQGHVMEADGVTVKETFAFMLGAVGESDRDELLCYWEFVRRYMEDGPASVADIIEYCLPIADHREGFTFAFHRSHGYYGAAPAPLMIWLLLLFLITYPGRWLAMRTSKLPRWPQEIEQACVVEANDPYRKDASMNVPITDHTSIYFVAAVGVALLAAWVWW